MSWSVGSCKVDFDLSRRRFYRPEKSATHDMSVVIDRVPMLDLSPFVEGFETGKQDVARRIDVETRPEFFVINIGDLMMRWTNDGWLSNKHRVVNPPPDIANNVSRISIAFFHQPNYDAVIQCIPTCAGPGRPERYPPIRSGYYCDIKYEETLVAGEVS